MRMCMFDLLCARRDSKVQIYRRESPTQGSSDRKAVSLLALKSRRAAVIRSIVRECTSLHGSLSVRRVSR